MIAAIVLALSRTLGETIAVLMVCGNLAIVPGSVLDACYPIPALIANNYGEMLNISNYEILGRKAADTLWLISPKTRYKQKSKQGSSGVGLRLR